MSAVINDREGATIVRIGSRLGYDLSVIIGGFIAICVVLLILAFLAPRLSRYPQRGVDKGLGMGSRTGSKAPGKLGKWLPKPFNTGMKAANKSAKKGRRCCGVSL